MYEMKRESREATVSYNPNVFSSPDELEEDSLYENAAVCAVVEKTPTSEKKILSILKPFAPVAVCWVVLVIIMALRIHFTSVISAKLSDELEASDYVYQNLIDAIEENAVCKWRHSNLEVEIDTLNQTNAVLQSNITNLTDENQQLKAEMKQMREKMDQMKAEIQNRTAENITRMYGPTVSPYWTRPCYYYRKKRQAGLCQAGWLHFRSKCFLICSRDSPEDRKTWQEARDDCRGKDADLVSMQSPEEQDFIYSNAAGFGVDGFWIGLRVEGSSWKWIDGNNLTDNYWIQPPADDQDCAIAVKDGRGWRSESCDGRKEWICQKDALPN